jgi:putative colanic acid biosynthesis acetyltransferase WcaB
VPPASPTADSATDRPTALAAVLRADLRANRGYPKSVLVLVLLRLAQAARGRRVLYVPAATLYKFVAEWVLGVEIPPTTPVGPGLKLRHGVGVVVNPAARIGANVMLRHGVTLGNRRTATDCPVVEDDVEIGAGATIVGPVTIGRGARIGANTVVIHDVPAGGVAHAAPAVIREGQRRDRARRA